MCVFLTVSRTVFLLTGQSGLGKSTLMNTLFKSKVSRKSVLATAQEKIPKTIEIKSISHGMGLLNPSTLLCAPSVFCLSVGLSAKIHSSHTFSYLHVFTLFPFVSRKVCILLDKSLQTFLVPSPFSLYMSSFFSLTLILFYNLLFKK